MDLTNVLIHNMSYESEIEISCDLYENTDVIDMKDVVLKFSIHKNANQDDILDLFCQGIFLLEDARTLEVVPYPFQVEITDKITEDSEISGRFLKNSQNTLDILGILWENIVLEIPISYTKADELISENEGWSIGKSSDEKIDPRLAPLMGLFDKEKE